jgi:hypothetical protein
MRARATQAIEASQPTAGMAETSTASATAPTRSNVQPSETTPMSAVERFRQGLLAAASTGTAQQRRRASQGEGNAGRFWEDLSTAATWRAEQRRRAPQGERPGRSRLATSVERSESDGPIGPTMNPEAWPTIQASPEHSTRRSRRPGAPGSQEPGARSPEPGARSPEPGARSPAPEARSPEPGARASDSGRRAPAPACRRRPPTPGGRPLVGARRGALRRPKPGARRRGRGGGGSGGGWV